MKDTIKIMDDEAKTEEILLLPVKAEGYLAFYCMSTNDVGANMWCMATVPYDPGQARSLYKHPYPLFVSRDEAIESCKKSLPDGGKMKIVKIVF